MKEPSNHYKVGTILIQQGIYTSSKELRELVKLYNKWEMPIAKRFQDIIDNQEPFINFVKELKQI
jgi:hypothetical protein